MTDSRSDAELSRDVARDAGRLLLALRSDFMAQFGDGNATTPEGGAIDKETANLLRDRADAAAHVLISEAIAEARPDDAILSEEGKDNADRLDAARVWIVDPLDGTWEYGQNRRDFAVHIALWEPATATLSACTVDLPAQETARTVLDVVEAPPALPTDRPIRIVASRSRPPATLAATVEILARRLAESGVTTHGVEIVDVGSVGAKVNEILCGRAEAYVHDTGFYEWDVAAPYGVASHYGLIASHVDGSPVTFNHMPPYVTDLVVAHPALHADLLEALSEAASS